MRNKKSYLTIYNIKYDSKYNFNFINYIINFFCFK